MFTFALVKLFFARSSVASVVAARNASTADDVVVGGGITSGSRDGDSRARTYRRGVAKEFLAFECAATALLLKNSNFRRVRADGRTDGRDDAPRVAAGDYTYTILR